MRKLFILPLIILVGCSIPAEQTVKTSNQSAKVEVLFTDEDGYKIKRFQDHGTYIYYATPGAIELTAVTTTVDGDGNTSIYTNKVQTHE